ncbi:MAG: biotin-dependent carboxyltransferase family protein [Rhodobacteraceae bacterium]|nr:biotin-dependent carboxyltransferase family protein [Paracoccaceae bacterium]
MLKVIKPGLETSVQDWPGRIGFANQGFPVSGPFDSWSFRLANLLVGNPPGTAGLEAQFLGPTLAFTDDRLIAVTGADMRPTLDGVPLPMWESVAVTAGQVLALGPARSGARAYLAVAGGIATPPMLGSRATFHKAGVGGLGGHALSEGAGLPLGPAPRPGAAPGRRVAPGARPPIGQGKRHEVEAVRGPNDDWIDDAGHATFYGTDWVLTGRSDRTGYRLQGPVLSFAGRARDKPVEHGAQPANIIDQGYPLGAVNLAGDTLIILVQDGPSMGGFINPWTVPYAVFWKLAQARPGDILRFREVGVEEAQALARDLGRKCTPAAIVT